MNLTKEQKIKILENRKHLVESIVSAINESYKETILLEKPNLKYSDIEDPTADPEAFQRAAGDYWKRYKPSDEKKPKGFLSRLGQKLRKSSGRVDPSLDVDDPGFTAKSIVDSVKKTKKQLSNFQATSLNTTKNINKLHDKIVGLINKFESFSETLPQEMRGKAEREVVGLAQKFYSLLKDEKERIDSYMEMMKSDLDSSGRQGAIAEDTMDNMSSMSITENNEENSYERLTLSWGNIPNIKELEERMNGEDFNMSLVNQDGLAWDYAMTLAKANFEPLKISDSSEFYDVLSILTGVKHEEDLDESERDMVEEILDRWHERYEDQEIGEVAESLASSMLDVLGVEWV